MLSVRPVRRGLTRRARSPRHRRGGDGEGNGGNEIDPFGFDGLAGTGLVLRIAEAGSMERFTVHFETTEVPAPAVTPVLAGMLMGLRRRRR